MSAGSPLAFRRSGGAVILRRALLWCFSVLVFVSVGQSGRNAFVVYKSTAPTLRAVGSGLSIARSVLAGVGIRDPLQLLRLS
jgi:hypothetical protein